MTAPFSNYQQVTGFGINFCRQDCLPTIRMCSEAEEPGDLFLRAYGLTIAFLLMTLMSSMMLSELSDIEFPYYFTQMLCGCCCKPVVTPKLVVDVLKWPYKHQMSSNDLKMSKKVINHRDPYNGRTLVHQMFYMLHFEELELLIERGGDVRIRDNYGKDVKTLLEEKVEETKALGYNTGIEMILDGLKDIEDAQVQIQNSHISC